MGTHKIHSLSEELIEKNLNKADLLDSPNCLSWGFYSNGTMNLPSSLHLWLLVKCWMTEVLQEIRLLGRLIFPRIY